MSRYLLDTNILVYFGKGHFDIASKISKVGFDSCFLSEITIAEMLYGAVNSEITRRKTNLENVAELLVRLKAGFC